MIDNDGITNDDFQITQISNDDKELVAHYISDHWGSYLCVSRGRLYDTAQLPGFIYKENNQVIGLVTYQIHEKDCEITTLNSDVKNKGLGTRLINKVIEMAKNNNCKRVWLITTNDNTHAIRFYQKRGFEWVGFYRNAMSESRKLKPEIPEFGDDSIPIKHELEFEYEIER